MSSLRSGWHAWPLSSVPEHATASAAAFVVVLAMVVAVVVDVAVVVAAWTSRRPRIWLRHPVLHVVGGGVAVATLPWPVVGGVPLLLDREMTWTVDVPWMPA